ncbi:T9SS type A sorting domain-containing protein [Winogradskyella helgolandensis]|uniref:T9SS type A sorting domain-containing protein n=1 Tax=Winogradskyella helgolandensis TaxID=2697010 RepID=UPI0015B7A67B|nr:T9SS type A sorting domain-containing protein [Winogradskyella helgolandensis]
MKKIYFLLLTLLVASFSFGQDMIITGAFDGPLTGGTPKLIEIYVVNDIADLSTYGFGSATNGGGTDGEELTFAGSASAGDFIYVGFEGSGGSENPGSTNAYFGITPDYIDSNAAINGDDALEIFSGGAVIDTFGDINNDGTDTSWEYLDGWAYRVDGTGPDGSNFVESNWTFSGPNAVDGCTDNTSCASIFPIGTYSTVGSTAPSITITSPSNNSALAPGTTSVTLSINVQNFNVGATTGGFDGHIHWTVNGTAQPMKYDTNDEILTVADGQSYTVFMQLVDNSHTPIAPAVETTIMFSVASLNQVASITELRAGTLGETYELTGEAIISYIVTDGTRNQKYIQDGGAGILIDDSAGLLSTTFSIGDGVTGLKGQLTEYRGTLQFIPTQNVASASSTGNTLTPIVVSVSDLLNNGENYESRLITINSATFADAGTFTDNTNYNISEGADTTICRVAFGDEDLIGTDIPTTAVSITGLGGQFDDDYQIFPRYTSDIAAPLSVTNFNATTFSLYPNPTNTGSVSISSTNSDAISVQVFDILGKQVKNQTITNNTLNVANLKSGVYIVKITQNNASTTKKLVIK